MKTIQARDVQKKLEAGEKLHLIDVREVFEYEEGYIPGVIHIPLGLLEARMSELDKKKPYIIVCQSGGRSGQATNYLESYGYDATNMPGGMIAWNGAIERSFK